MSRLLPYVALVLVVLVLTGGLLWYLAYDLGDGPPPTDGLAALDDSVRITWHGLSATTIEARSRLDALRALGYVHGQEHPWPLLLWRQTALGALGTWFGPGVLDLDRLGRWLGWATVARATYADLPPADRAVLSAYTDGVNAALRNAPARYRDEVVLLDIPIEPWEPWHTLALERLFAWLATPPSAPDSVHLPDQVRAFLALDDGLREWLHLFGFDFSYAWVQSHAGTTYVAQRHVYGNTTQLLYHDVRVHLPDRTLQAASLPGTPFFPAGQTDTQAWALLWSSTPQLRNRQPVADTVRTRFERIQVADGSETLVRAFQDGNVLYLTPDRPVPGDSLWTLTWPGLLPGTDLTAWQALPTDSLPAFRLLRGDGLRVTHDGSWTVLGHPAVQEPLRDGILVSNNAWSQPVAAHLDSMHQADPAYLPSGTWQTDSYSRWAARMTTQLLARMDSLPAPAPATTDALTYLRNWDFTYSRASIAATILEAWLTTYREAHGSLPTPQDTLAESLDRYGMTLDLALARLTETYGSDLSLWRWERTAPRMRYFPVWSATDTRVLLDLPDAGNRFEPMYLLGYGHPSTLYWSPSAVVGPRSGPSVWESWTTTVGPNAWTTRNRHPDHQGFLVRILDTEEDVAPQRIDTLDAARITRLYPSRR